MQTEIIRQMIVLRPAVLTTIGVSIIAYLVMLPVVGRITAQGEHSRVAGLFIGMGFQSFLHMSIAWIRFVMFTFVMLSAKHVQPVFYLFLAALTIVGCLSCLKPRSILTELFSFAFQAVAFWVGSRLIDYLNQIRYDPGIKAAYWMLTAMLILCSVAVFLKEIVYISAERKHYDANGETE